MKSIVIAAVAAVAIGAAGSASASEAQAKSAGCMTCHDVSAKKMGPAFKEVAAKYKGKADGEEKIMHQITSGEKVKLDDGSEEEHKIIKTQDKGEISNLIAWILSLAK